MLCVAIFGPSILLGSAFISNLLDGYDKNGVCTNNKKNTNVPRQHHLRHQSRTIPIIPKSNNQEHLAASDDDLSAFESIIPCDGGVLVPPSIFHAMEAKHKIRKCARTLWSDNNIEAMENGVNPEDVVLGTL